MPVKRRRVTRRTATPPVEQSFPQYNYQTPAPQQPNKLLYGLILLNLLFTGFLFYKLQSNPSASSTTTAQAAANGQPTAAALSADNLKKYAKDLGLNSNQFNTCLDKNQRKDYVAADAQQAASLGVNGTPGFFINGRFLAGAFPYDNFKEIIDKELSGEANGTCDVYSDSLKSYCSTDGKNGFDPTPKQIDIGNAPMVGPADAPVTIVEFSDFQCPFCQKAYPTVKKILKDYPTQVKLYYKNLPLFQIHPDAQRAAEAGACAQVQNKFWQYHDKLFESQGASAT